MFTRGRETFLSGINSRRRACGENRNIETFRGKRGDTASISLDESFHRETDHAFNTTLTRRSSSILENERSKDRNRGWSCKDIPRYRIGPRYAACALCGSPAADRKKERKKKEKEKENYQR